MINSFDELEKYLTPKDIQNHLGFGKDKVYALLNEPGFPSIKIGSSYRVSLNDYNEWLKKQKKLGKHF